MKREPCCNKYSSHADIYPVGNVHIRAVMFYSSKLLFKVVIYNIKAMVLELHVWGSKTQISSFDAESIASAKYLSLMCEPYGYIVIPSSNTDISPTGKLPALRDGEVVIGGYYNIVKYLKETGKDLDSWMTPKQRSQNTAYVSLSFLTNNFKYFTRYVC